LDVHNDKTGTHALCAKFGEFEIMFHVSTFLPFDEDETQQVSRKRHLGNDIVVIIFQEKGNHPVFDPRCMKSFFNHVFIVIRKDEEESQLRGETMYRIGVCYKDGIEVCGPGVPLNSLFQKSEEFRNWLHTKMINCERASYSAPSFKKALERTRRQLIQLLHDEYHPATEW